MKLLLEIMHIEKSNNYWEYEIKIQIKLCIYKTSTKFNTTPAPFNFHRNKAWELSLILLEIY